MISYSLAFNAIFLSIKGQLFGAIDTIYPDFKGIFDMVLHYIRQRGIEDTCKAIVINSQTIKSQAIKDLATKIKASHASRRHGIDE